MRGWFEKRIGLGRVCLRDFVSVICEDLNATTTVVVCLEALQGESVVALVFATSTGAGSNQISVAIRILKECSRCRIDIGYVLLLGRLDWSRDAVNHGRSR